jgi:hypothetical protein
MLTPVGDEIVRELERLNNGQYSPSQIFDDWLRLTHIALKSLPDFIRWQVQGVPYIDSPEDQGFFAELETQFPKSKWDHFTKAFQTLLESTEHGYYDTLGEIFMAWGNPNKRSGQFFTPMPVARMMAEVQDIPGLLYQRLKEAGEGDPAVQAISLAGMLIRDPEKQFDFFLTRMLPLLAPKIKPIYVLDPAVGSGVMLLAAAATSPRWALDCGLIQFYGIDIDALACRMAECNLMLYGLNGFGIKCANELKGADLNALAGPYRQQYQAALQAGPEELIDIQNELRSMQPSDGRLLLFDQATFGSCFRPDARPKALRPKTAKLDPKKGQLSFL